MSQTQDVYRLQTIDTAVEESAQRVRLLESSLGESAGLLDARQELSRLENELARWRAEQEDRELEINELAERIAKDEQLLYSGRKTNPKELAGLQENIAALRRRRSAVEDKLLEAMLMVDEAQGELASHREALLGIEKSWREEQDRFIGELDDLRACRERLLAERARLLRLIPANNLALYEELRARKGGRAVVLLLKGGNCQGCGMCIPTRQAQQVRSGQEFVLCSSCGRILHANS